MMSAKLAMFLAQAPAGLRPQDVFATSLYTGNGSTQTITNGINLSGEGGLVWVKSRNSTLPHHLVDTVRGRANYLYSNTTDAQNLYGADSTGRGLSAFNSNGFSLGQNQGSEINTSSTTYASWTFRRAPKFFDVVTWTGNGGGNRTIPHSLGIAPGFIQTKRVNFSDNWWNHHRAVTSPNANWWRNYGILNTTNAFLDWGDNSGLYQAPDATNLYVGSYYNANGVTYIAYLFAHDTDASGIVQCGSFTGINSEVSVNLGWRPQFLLTKNASASERWKMFDSARGLPTSGDAPRLSPNESNSESTQSYASGGVRSTSTGFTYQDTGAINGNTVIYLAIREPI